MKFSKQLVAAMVAAVLVGGVAYSYDFRKLVVLKLHATSISVGESETETTVGQIAGLSSVSSEDLAATDDLTVGDDATITGTITAGVILGPVPTTQVIAATNTIAADACGGLKRISSASAVTTNTTNTFTAPAAGNKGCVMFLYNVNASDAITLDNNALFESTDGADVVLDAKGRIAVVSDGAVWVQVAPLEDNLS